MKKIIFIFLAAALFNTVFSTDTVSTKYFPLKIGNSWTYVVSHFFPPAYYRIKLTIISSSVYNGHLYYKMSDQSEYRVDSLNGKLLKRRDDCPESQFEILIDSLSAQQSDTAVLHCQGFGIYNSICLEDTIHFTSFGLNKISKKYRHAGFELGEDTYYAKDIGIYYIYTSSAFSDGYKMLTGCLINGIVYGDTTLIGINKISTQIPKTYSLYQNYPNPFNPLTKIKFDVTAVGKGDVKLIVYDALGREAAVLINEQLKAGTYEAEWNASNYPSGVYFYKLTAGKFTQTKKMVLIK
jgi:hypothetical protein